MCEHERLKTVGDRVFCCKCCAELPIEFLLGQNKADDKAEPKKAPARKRTAKKEVS